MRSIIKWLLAPFYWPLMNLLRGHKVQSRTVGFRATIGRKSIIRKGSEVGPNVTLGDYSYISGPHAYVEEATIGRFCSIARRVTIGVSGHDYTMVTTHPFILDPSYGICTEPGSEAQSGPPIIGNDVWIGMGAFVMRGVTIGDGAVIAANAVVVSDVAPYSIVGGIPAKHIKYRFTPTVITALLDIQWWNWDDAKLQSHIAQFKDVGSFVANQVAARKSR